MKKILLTGLLSFSALSMFGVGVANALPLQAPVPTNAYITKGGYDVAWAAPCAAEQPSCGPIDLTYQSQFGWQIMSSALFTQLAITAFDFVVTGGNVDYATGNNLDELSGAWLAALTSPYPGGDVAIASPYFSTMHFHADWVNGIDGLWDPISTAAHAEALVVRQHQGNVVPEPSTFLLLAGGISGLGLMGWRKSRKA